MPKILALGIACIALTSCGKSEPINDTPPDIFNFSDRDAIIALLDNEADVSFNKSIMSKDGKYFLECRDEIHEIIGSNEIHSVTKYTTSGKVYDFVISVESTENNEYLLSDVLNIFERYTGSEVRNLVEDEINNKSDVSNTITVDNTDIQLNYLNRPISKTEVVFVPHPNAEEKIEEHKKFLIQSGLSEEEVNSNDYSDLFGDFETHTTEANLIILGATIPGNYVESISNLYIDENSDRETLRKSLICNPNSIDLLDLGCYNLTGYEISGINTAKNGNNFELISKFDKFENEICVHGNLYSNNEYSEFVIDVTSELEFDTASNVIESELNSIYTGLELIDESVVNNDIIHHYSNDVCNANVTYRFEDDTQLYTVEAVITNI